MPSSKLHLGGAILNIYSPKLRQGCTPVPRSFVRLLAMEREEECEGKKESHLQSSHSDCLAVHTSPCKLAHKCAHACMQYAGMDCALPTPQGTHKQRAMDVEQLRWWKPGWFKRNTACSAGRSFAATFNVHRARACIPSARSAVCMTQRERE